MRAGVALVGLDGGFDRDPPSPASLRTGAGFWARLFAAVLLAAEGVAEGDDEETSPGGVRSDMASAVADAGWENEAVDCTVPRPGIAVDGFGVTASGFLLGTRETGVGSPVVGERRAHMSSE